MQGLYIVIEGPQGVGKSTQVKLLANALSLINVPYKTFIEPDNTTNISTQTISKITQDPSYPLNPKAEVLLYNASRAISLETIIKYKNNGFVCIVDRSFLSTLAVQYYGSNNNLDHNSIINIINFSVGNNQPDYMIVLDAPAQFLHQRQIERNEHERFDSLGLNILDKIRAGYLIEAKKRNIPVIVATESPIKVHAKIWVHIQKVINNNYTKQQYLCMNDKNAHNYTANNKQYVLDNIKLNNIQISELLLSRILKDIKISIHKRSNEYDFVVPNNISKEVKLKYIHALKKLAGYNLQINNKLKNTSSNDAVVLSAINSIDIIGKYNDYKNILCTLLTIKSHESLNTYNILRSKLQYYNNKQFDSNFFNLLEKNVNKISKSNQEIYKQTNTILAGSYSNSLDLIQLINFSPKNEITLLNNVLYQYTDLSCQEIDIQLVELGYTAKASLLSKYINSKNITGLPAYYNWEIITSYSNYLTFSSLSYVNINNQNISPRYGYSIPTKIEQSDALDEYLECFDTSLELHSMLVANNVPEDIAQYACLKGHKVRFSLQTNLDQSLKIINLLNKSDNSDLSNIAKYMIQKISETHPILSEAITLD